LVILSALFGLVYQIAFNPVGRGLFAYLLTFATAFLPGVIIGRSMYRLQRLDPMARLLHASLLLWTNGLLLVYWSGICGFVVLQLGIERVARASSPATADAIDGFVSLRPVLWIYLSAAFLHSGLIGISLQQVCRSYERLVLGLAEAISRTANNDETSGAAGL
jgi:hypothetical protein